MHKPVLLNQTIEYLNIKDAIYVDCTVGLGGHSLEILNNLNGKGMLIGIECDEVSLNIAKEKLKKFNNCYLFHSNYKNLKDILKEQKIQKITGGIILDLGVNSFQLDDPDRGFSFKKEGPIDMRMNRDQLLSGLEVINKYHQKQLAEIIYKYGEERYARKIAKLISEKRTKSPIKTTQKLKEIILECYPKWKKFKTHPATRTFQAIRIEVNKELENLEQFLCFIPELLDSGSRLTVISFHSLEDRIVKNSLKNNNFKIITKKPITPSKKEINENPRARSAKLRAAERV